MGGTSKLIVISHLHVCFFLSFALTNVKFWVVPLICSWMHSPPFSVEVLCSQNHLVVFRVCLLLLAFIPVHGYLISVLFERGMWGREIASHSAFCISLYLDFDSPFSHPLPYSLPDFPSQKQPKNQTLNITGLQKAELF